MTWPQIDRGDRSAVVLIPFGAVEQHSFHLPLGTDSIIVEGIARRLEAAMPDQVCLLPTVFLGCSKHHMAFAGSLTTEVETFIEVGMQLAESMFAHGFKNVLLLNGHGGNTDKISIMAEKLTYRLGSQAKVAGVTYWHLIRKEIQEIRETERGGIGHACEMETSIVLALTPELVHRDQMQAGGLHRGTKFVSGDMFEAGSISVSRSFDRISAHGGLGDPTSASARKGEAILNAIQDKLVGVVEEIRTGAF